MPAVYRDNPQQRHLQRVEEWCAEWGCAGCPLCGGNVSTTYVAQRQVYTHHGMIWESSARAMCFACDMLVDSKDIVEYEDGSTHRGRSE